MNYKEIVHPFSKIILYCSFIINFRQLVVYLCIIKMVSTTPFSIVKCFFSNSFY